MESLPKFEQFFDGAQFRKGMELAFTSTKAGGLAARIDSRDVSDFCLAVELKYMRRLVHRHLM